MTRRLRLCRPAKPQAAAPVATRFRRTIKDIHSMRFATWTILLYGLNYLPVSAAEPWSTYRGNPQRSGNADGKAGPAKPDVLWVHKGQDHYIASPVPLADRLFVSGFSGFNLPTVAVLDTAPKVTRRIIWSKGIPLFKLPTVASPAVSGGKLIFGDGMH